MWKFLNKDDPEDSTSNKTYEEILSEYEKFFSLDEEIINK